jgi:hypothetical protein
MHFIRKPSSIALSLIAIINLYFLVDVRLCDHGGTNWQTVIYSDGKGYYEYLRSAFINHDLDHQDPQLGFLVKTPDGYLIKYFAGTALALSPFFAMACLESVLLNEPLNGYSYPFQIMIAFAGWFYCILGLFFLNRLLTIFRINEWIRAAVLLLITYATGLFYYAILEPAMSHVYSFAAITIFLYAGYRYFETFRTSYLIGAAVAFGLTILIRPTNGVIIFMLPFLVQSRQSISEFFSHYSHLLLAVAILGCFVAIQMLSWYLQVGKCIVWPYKDEGFYFTKPSLLNVLFSYRKGLLAYAPLTLVAFLGFIPLYRINRTAFWSVLLTLSAVLYIISCWWIGITVIHSVCGP